MKQPSQARAATKKHVILFLAANPRDMGRLALDREARSIHVELKQSGYRDRFDFVTRWAVEPLDLLRELRELKPTIVHFSGHGAHPAGIVEAVPGRDVSGPSGDGPGGVVFDSANGDSHVVSAEAIAQAFGAVGTQVRLVVLNACYTASMAEALLAHVDCVVGMSGAIYDDAARSFAIGFYGGLGEHESVTAALKQGTAAISLEGLPDGKRPQLRVRDGFDAAQLILAAVEPSVLDIPCPYPGMRPFTVDDTASFHGRDAQIDELIDRLRAGEREIYVIGPSGSGKSSLVAAGVLPRLARGVAGLGPSVVRALRPGEQPATRLSEALNLPPGQLFAAAEAIGALLTHRSSGSWVLLVIDQLEELFTQATASERDAFLGALCALRGDRRCAVILTLRADFLGALMESPLWPERVRDQLSRIEVSSLRGQALREAIAAPARDAGVAVDPELIERMLADAASEPGTLPLLQETMVQLWNKRTDQMLTLADYEALGDGVRSGLAVALARRADATLRRFKSAQTGIARRILLRLISFGEGRSDTRRQQPRAQLHATGDDAADFAFVLQAMVDDRLLTVDEDVTGEPRVDLAHEIMISAWPKFADWIRSHRADEQRRRQFEAAAAQWVEHGRGARSLLDAIQLADAEAWQRTESALHVGHSAQVMALIAASRAWHNKQRGRRRRLLGGAFAVLAAFAAVVAVLAIALRDQANSARREATHAQHLLAQSYAEEGRRLLVDGHYQEAVPYLLEARRNGLDSPPLRMMFWTASRRLPLVPALEHQHAVRSAAFSPDGTCVVTASEDKTARVWDAATGRPLTAPLRHRGRVEKAAFSSDGTRVVTASSDKTAQVWDAATGKPVTGPLNHQGVVVSAMFSLDGTHVVTASSDKTAQVWDAATGKPVTGPLNHQGVVVSAMFSLDGTHVVTASWDKTARVWDAATGKPAAAPLVHQGQVQSAAFSPDGARVVTASWDKTARVWDAATGKPITSSLVHQGPVMSAVFSPDGTRVVTASWDKTARVWDAATGKPAAAPLVHQGQVQSAAFSPDGTRIVTASSDKTAQVWDAATGKPAAAPLVHQGQVQSAAFSPDGARVVTASWDKTARVWDAATGKPITSSLVHQGPVMSAVFSPDGTRVVTASWDKTARVWDAATGKPAAAPLVHQGQVQSAAFSPDGTRIVTASSDKTAQVWDAAIGKSATAPLVHQGPVQSAAFSPDGTRVVTASEDKTVRVWDATTGNPLTNSFEHQDKVWSAAFSPDGTRVVAASEDKTARVWRTGTGGPMASLLEHQGNVRSAAFSPDGTRVVTASLDGVARVWDATTDRVTTLEHQEAVERAAFSPNGTRVVTASLDRTARVWDAATGKPVTSPLVHQGPVLSAVFSPDGTRVVTASWDNTARIWDAVAGTPLTSPLEHQAAVKSAVFSPDGTRVVTASFDHTARVWDAATGKPLTSRLLHSDQVEEAAFSPDGTRIVTASGDGTARVWNATTGEATTIPLEHQGGVKHAEFTADGTRVVTASVDKTARVWEAATGKPVTSSLVHQGPVVSAAFSPDGTRVVTASSDKTALVWDAATGKPVTSSLVHQGPVVSAAFSPDGTRVITASEDRTARIWDVRLDEGTLEQWSAMAERSPFVFDGIALTRRRAPLTRARPVE